MGERSKDALRVNFDQKLKLEFHGTKVSFPKKTVRWLQFEEDFDIIMELKSPQKCFKTRKMGNLG